MNDEDYVDFNVITFEQAKLLKKKGFPQRTWPYVYFPNGDYEVSCCNPRLPNEKEWYCGSPLQLVQKWLRDKKGIIVDVLLYNGYKPLCYDSNVYINNNTSFGKVQCGLHLTYDRALSAGIDKALKLL